MHFSVPGSVRSSPFVSAGVWPVMNFTMLLNCCSPANGPSKLAELLLHLGRQTDMLSAELSRSLARSPIVPAKSLLQHITHRAVEFLGLRDRHAVHLDAGDGQAGAGKDIEDVARAAVGELEIVGLDDDQRALVARIGDGRRPPSPAGRRRCRCTWPRSSAWCALPRIFGEASTAGSKYFHRAVAVERRCRRRYRGSIRRRGSSP